MSIANQIDAPTFPHSQDSSSEIQQVAFQHSSAFVGKMPLSHLKSIHLKPLAVETGVADVDTAPLPIQRPLPEVSHENGQFQVEQLKVMSSRQRKQYLALTALWLAVNIYFWLWWFDAGHIGNPLLYGLMSIALFYSATVLPSFYTFYLGQMRKPKAIDVARAESAGVVGKVAVISLTVPGSESLEFVKRQLVAMQEISLPT